MENISIIESPKGTYSCAIDITVEEWETILKDKTLTTQNYKEALLSFYGESGHKATCGDLAQKYYGNTKDASKYVAWIVAFGKAVVKRLNRFQIIDGDGSERFWHVAIDPGKVLPNGTFEWTLRPELVQAIKNLGWGGRFSWVPFYTEMADKLLAYKDNRNALLSIVYGLNKKTVKYIREDDGSQVPDIDPFTVLGIFNRNMTSQNRIEIAEHFKNALDIQSALPCDFDGIPVLNPQKATFFHRDKVNEDVQTLWDVYEAALTGDKAKLASSMNEALSHHGVKWNLTMGLYWIRPHDYIALDENSRTYLPQIGIDVFKDKDLNADNYLDLLEHVKQAMLGRRIKETSIPEISYNAWFGRYTRSFWLLGYSYGGNKSQLERFLNEGIWEGKFDASKPVSKKQYDTALTIKEGDVIILKSSSVKGTNHDIPFLRIKAVGEVISSMKNWKENDDEVCQCKVKYYRTDVKDFEGSEYGAFRQTIHKADNKVKAIIEYAKRVIGTASKDNMIDPKLKEYISLLEENHNLVLTGAPGTGKTYLAKQIAQAMGTDESLRNFVQFHPSHDYTDFVEGLRPNREGDGFERRDGVFKAFCKIALQNMEDSKKSGKELAEERTFEEQYNEMIDRIEAGELSAFPLRMEGKVMEVVEISSYKNIILRTPSSTSNRTYTVSLERLKKLSKVYKNSADLESISNINEEIREAIKGCNASSYWAVLYEIYKHKPIKTVSQEQEIKKNFVFIIDEINRGDLSKIFGELFFSIDPGYRGATGRVQTQYQNMIDSADVFAEGFYIPENVYIIATMNDIDRSVESMDFAMRRRFTWIEVTPEDRIDMLEQLPQKDEAIRRMKSLNKAIEATEGLGAAFQIGPAYFLKLKNGDFQRLWRLNIEPLLKEYLRGFRKAEETLQKFEKAYNLAEV